MKTPERHTTWLGVTSLVGSSLLYSLFGVFSRTIGSSLALFYQNATRAVLASLLIAIVITIQKEWTTISNKDFAWMFLRCICSVAGTAIFVYTVLFLPLGTFYFIFYAGSIIGGYLFGRIFLGDKITTIKIASLLVAGVGLALIFSVPSTTLQIKYLFFAMISGLFIALYNILSAKISTNNSPILVTFMDNAISIPLYGGISFILKEVWVSPAWNNVWGANILFSLAMVGTGSLIVYGFRHLDSHVGSLITLSEILFATLFGYFLYHEQLQPMTIVGGICIIGAISIVHLKINKATIN